MKKLIKIPAFLILSLGLFCLTGCEDNNLEDAGNEVGDAVENAGDNIQDAAN